MILFGYRLDFVSVLRYLLGAGHSPSVHFLELSHDLKSDLNNRGDNQDGRCQGDDQDQNRD